MKQTTKNDRQRGYILTLNNPTEEQVADWATIPDRLDLKLGICAEEYGSESGHHHLHAYIEMKNAKTWDAMLKWMGGQQNCNDLQVRMGTPWEAWVYVEKDGSIIWTVGERPEEKKTSTGDAWPKIQQMVKDGLSYLDICEEYPKLGIRMGAAIQRYMLEYQRSSMESWRRVRVTYVQGTTGAGKTRAVMEAMGGMQNVFRVTNYKHPFDGYAGQSVIVFEEFRSSLPLTEMLVYLEGWVTPLKCRYADRMSEYTRVFVISNMNLGTQYSKMQREIEHELDDEIREGKQRSLNAFYRRFEIMDGCFEDIGMDGLDIVTIESNEDSKQFKARLLAEQNAEEEE